MNRSTREDWAARVAKWKESGLTAAEFAPRVGVNARSLTWWRWRLASKTPSVSSKRSLARRAPEAVTKATTISPLTFVEMTAAIDTEPLEVVLPSTVRIRVRPGFDGATLVRLLDVLERR